MCTESLMHTDPRGAVARRITAEKQGLAPARQPGDRNIRICEPIDHAAWLWHPEAAADQPAFVRFGCSFVSDGDRVVALRGREITV